ncbi:ABC transporter ATP-binding protein [Kaistia algarum]|uniref:ABC transporter ATP-binding protein n=1 Tax=Kaistia algarum TaxID=2083279 RepID=UPI000CE8D729|nr:sn-glycerol-3-phosphate ABC transporter ATP-binding protein UgpC [Kaistia algarum]MCX5516733.1 sn-glycerol-3-phosphate ABC transporter ATP-binding protein UgpC [Kaistia algarum]PPE78626.1 ABC transporter ATP-binding protein [Kaistia algarum]
MANISIQGVTKRFPNGADAVSNVSLEIADGEFVVLVGPSGCGKSTLLRMVAGLEDISSGEITVGGKRINDLPPKDRDIAMIFQTYALFPHMTVEQNLSFGLKIRGTARPEAERRIKAAAETLGLMPLMARRPTQLSGGQRQRVAIGRALVRDPSVFLMDEPLSNLDTKLRVHMRTEFARLREQLKTTTIYVTHDQIEAMTLGHRVCVMRNGRVQQIDTPERLFARPTNIFVAGFIGSPEMNFARAKVGEGELHIGTVTLPIAADANLSDRRGEDIIVGMRPTDFREFDGAAGWSPITAQVELVERLGSEVMLVFPMETPTIRADQFDGTSADPETDFTATAANQSLFKARLDGTSRIAPRETARLAVRPEALHYFDAKTGVSIGRSD